MKVLVTGAVGSVGVWVVQRLLDEGHEVLGVDLRDDFSNRPLLEGTFPLVRLDVGATAELASLLAREHVDAICHTAAWVTAPNVTLDTEPYRGFATNGMGVVSVLEAARVAGVRTVACASTKAVYAPFEAPYAYPEYAPVPEDHPRGAEASSRSYDASKILGEEAGAYYSDRFDVTYRGCRFGTIVRAGKADLGGSFSAAYAAAVETVLRGETYRRRVVDGSRDDLTYVKDVAHGLVLATTSVTAESRYFNIGTGVASTFGDWAEAIRAVLPEARIELDLAEPTPGFQSRQGNLDISRARRELGYVPEYDLEAAVADLVERFSELATT